VVLSFEHSTEPSGYSKCANVLHERALAADDILSAMIFLCNRDSDVFCEKGMNF